LLEGFVGRFGEVGYSYRFDHGSPPFGSFHTAEIPYVFNSSDAPGIDKSLADKMVSWWISFARTGDPNTFAVPGSPNWPRYSGDRGGRLVINSTKMEVENLSKVHTRRCEYWLKKELDGWSGEGVGGDGGGVVKGDVDKRGVIVVNVGLVVPFALLSGMCVFVGLRRFGVVGGGKRPTHTRWTKVDTLET
ncbi:hypothetical protein HDU76_002787, partial [Blyttiomyces sp. JEL0837]